MGLNSVQQHEKAFSNGFHKIDGLVIFSPNLEKQHH